MDHASAVGFLYIDDGVSKSETYMRYDVYYSHNETDINQAYITFVNVSNGFYTADTGSEQVGIITIFNPLNDAAGSSRAFSKVTVTLTDETEVDITNQAYFAD